MSGVEEEFKEAGIKALASFVAPHEHTDYAIFEANDLAALESALHSMTMLGTAKLIPVIPTEQLREAMKKRVG